MTGRQIDARLAELRPHPQNYNRHSEAQVKRLAESLERFGQPKPIVIWRGLIIAGHGLVEAAQRLGWETLRAADTSEEWTEAQALAFVAADNELARLGDPDEAALAALAAGLADVDAELAALAAGTEERLAELLRNLRNSEELGDPGPQVDKASELQAKWGTATGQLWQLGEHRLICGDCTDPATVRRVMGGEQADYILTDPPYCSGGFQEAGRARGSVGTTVTHKKVAFDMLSTRGYVALIKAMLTTTDAPAAYVFTDWRMWATLLDVVEASGFGVRQMIVWDKGTPGLGRGWRAQHELILFALRGTVAFDKFAEAQGNVITAKRTGNTEHTTEKPLELLETIIGVMRDMRMVYDPFSGSGTTLIACERLGRRCRAVEIEPGYVAVALERWATMTGRTPVLVEPAAAAHDAPGDDEDGDGDEER